MKRKKNEPDRPEFTLADWIQFAIAYARPTCDKCGRPLELVYITDESGEVPELLYVKCTNRRCEIEYFPMVHFQPIDIPEG